MKKIITSATKTKELYPLISLQNLKRYLKDLSKYGFDQSNLADENYLDLSQYALKYENTYYSCTKQEIQSNWLENFPSKIFNNNKDVHKAYMFMIDAIYFYGENGEEQLILEVPHFKKVFKDISAPELCPHIKYDEGNLTDMKKSFAKRI